MVKVDRIVRSYGDSCKIFSITANGKVQEYKSPEEIPTEIKESNVSDWDVRDPSTTVLPFKFMEITVR